MTSPLPYLIRMLLFLGVVAGLSYYLLDDLLRVFMNTPDLDAVILGVLAIGIFFIFRQVILLWPEVNWLRRFQHREDNTPVPPSDRVNLLAPMAAMLGERQDQFRLSPTATRALLDGIATRLDERRELARYLIGLLIFLGLLGTFWGLLQTIGAVADAINGLQATGCRDHVHQAEEQHRRSAQRMSTALGASLFGLSVRWWVSSSCRPAPPGHFLSNSVTARDQSPRCRRDRRIGPHRGALTSATRGASTRSRARSSIESRHSAPTNRTWSPSNSLAEGDAHPAEPARPLYRTPIEMRSAVNRWATAGRRGHREALAARQRIEAANHSSRKGRKPRVAGRRIAAPFASDRTADETDRSPCSPGAQVEDQMPASPWK